MLILQRKEGESLLIGDEIEISIEAPKSISILRAELKKAAEVNREAADEEVSPLALLGVLPEHGRGKEDPKP